MDSPYPAHWEADVVLLDGGTAHVRPITPADGDRLRDFHRRQSPESIYFRFFAPYPKLTDRDVERFTTVDHDQRVAIVALIGADIVGVVRYDKVSAAEAEIAFNISDAHQGRGVGSVLFEHVVAAARERGVRRFVAEVLPNNRKMIAVFRDAGFAVRSEVEEGIVQLHFDIAPTDTSTAVMQAREHRAEARSIARLLNPGSVAVVGASRVYKSVGQTVLRNLLAAGFPGPVYPVNPGVAEVAGLRTYPSVGDVPGPIDLALVAVPAEAVGAVVADCGRKGVRGLVVLSAGYAETGPDGRARQRELVTVARSNGMRVVGPNSFGLLNTSTEVRLNASLSPVMPAGGRLGFFSQSGALSIAFLETLVQRGLGVSTFVSAGNRADVSGNDLLQYWEEEAGTDAILLYLESIGNPRKFSRLARRVAARKPIVAVKMGRFTQGAPLGHSVRASRAPAAAVDALFDQAGVIRVDNTAQLFDVGQLLVTQPLPAGERVAIVGNSATLGMLAADACVESGLTVAAGPVALGAEATAEDFRTALDAVFQDPAVDAVVAVFIPPLVARHEEVAAVLDSLAVGATKTVVSTFLGVRGLPERVLGADRPDATGSPADSPAAAPGKRAVPSYPTPEDAVRALAAATRYAAWRRRPRGSPVAVDRPDPAGARDVVAQALRDHPGGVDLQGPQLDLLLRCYDLIVWPTEPVRDADEAVRAAERLGYPVALKTAAENLRHRVDLGYVRLDLETEAQVRSAYRGLLAARGAASSVVVQRMAPPGVACVVASTEDQLFGPIVSFGLGGVATELLGDRAYRIPPLTDVDAAEMVRSVAAAPLLFGHRGAEPVDVPGLERILLLVSRLADDLPELAEFELNPVLVGVDGVTILHAALRLAQPELRVDTGPRRLSG